MEPVPPSSSSIMGEPASTRGGPPSMIGEPPPLNRTGEVPLDPPGPVVWQGPVLPRRPRAVGSGGYVAEVDQVLTLVGQKAGGDVEEMWLEVQELRRQVQSLQEGLQSMLASREREEQWIQHYKKETMSMAHECFGSLTETRFDMEEKLEELSSLQLGEAEQMRHVGSADIGSAFNRFKEQVERFVTHFEEQRHARQEDSERLRLEMDSSFQKAREAIQAEQQLRFQGEARNMRMIEDICAEMGGMLQHERAQREGLQGKMLSVLEEICCRVEAEARGGGGAAAAAETLQQRRPFLGGGLAQLRQEWRSPKHPSQEPLALGGSLEAPIIAPLRLSDRTAPLLTEDMPTYSSCADRISRLIDEPVATRRGN